MFNLFNIKANSSHSTVLKFVLPIVFFVLAILILTSALTVNAQLSNTFEGDIVECGEEGALSCQFCDLQVLAQNIINFLVFFAIIVAVLMFVYAGFLLVTAGANDGQITRGKSIFWTVFIGLFIILAAWLIIDLLMKTFLNEGDFGPWNELKCAAPVAVDSESSAFDTSFLTEAPSSEQIAQALTNVQNSLFEVQAQAAAVNTLDIESNPDSQMNNLASEENALANGMLIASENILQGVNTLVTLAVADPGMKDFEARFLRRALGATKVEAQIIASELNGAIRREAALMLINMANTGIQSANLIFNAVAAVEPLLDEPLELSTQTPALETEFEELIAQANLNRTLLDMLQSAVLTLPVAKENNSFLSRLFSKIRIQKSPIIVSAAGRFNTTPYGATSATLALASPLISEIDGKICLTYDVTKQCPYKIATGDCREKDTLTTTAGNEFCTDKGLTFEKYNLGPQTTPVVCPWDVAAKVCDSSCTTSCNTVLRSITCCGAEPPPSSPNLVSLTPSAGPHGTVVTVSGGGFVTDDTLLGNSVILSSPNIGVTVTVQGSSSDGSTLDFTVPETMVNAVCTNVWPTACSFTTPLPSGSYFVTVKNGNGISNTLPFTVQETVDETPTDPVPPDTTTATLDPAIEAAIIDAIQITGGIIVDLTAIQIQQIEHVLILANFILGLDSDALIALGFDPDVIAAEFGVSVSDLGNLTFVLAQDLADDTGGSGSDTSPSPDDAGFSDSFGGWVGAIIGGLAVIGPCAGCAVATMIGSQVIGVPTLGSLFGAVIDDAMGVTDTPDPVSSTPTGPGPGAGPGSEASGPGPGAGPGSSGSPGDSGEGTGAGPGAGPGSEGAGTSGGGNY